MSYDDVFNSRYGPRTARGGIKAQTARGSFGKNWWAQRWVNVIESLDLGGRLARGRVYARRGQVLSIDISEGVIEAKVQGSRALPYSVKIKVRTIPLEDWISFAQGVFNQALVAAKLLAGEMPKDIESLFESKKLSLFPKRMDEFETECSCPDFSNPCKHIASVHYLLGEEFDRDPFLIFKMRGLRKDKLIDLITSVDQVIESGEVESAPRLGQFTESDKPIANRGGPGSRKDKANQSSGADEGSSSSGKNGGSPGPGKAKRGSRSAKKAPDLPLEDFWKVHAVDSDGLLSIAPTSNAGLPKRLGNLPFWRSDYPFLPTLEQIYKVATENAINSLAQPLFSDRNGKD
ncbi:MAG TPA: SWIM zinc finger family protein [Drouetiella sp.]